MQLDADADGEQRSAGHDPGHDGIDALDALVACGEILVAVQVGEEELHRLPVTGSFQQVVVGVAQAFCLPGRQQPALGAQALPVILPEPGQPAPLELLRQPPRPRVPALSTGHGPAL
jgi:hypothetical protein